MRQRKNTNYTYVHTHTCMHTKELDSVVEVTNCLELVKPGDNPNSVLY